LRSVRVLRRLLVLLAITAVCLGVTAALTMSQAPSGQTLSHVAADQSGAAAPVDRICSATQKCVPTNPPNSSGTAAQFLGIAFVGSMIVVLAGVRRNRLPSVRTSATFDLPSRVYRPPITSS